jgi:hypothetical protein
MHEIPVCDFRKSVVRLGENRVSSAGTRCGPNVVKTSLSSRVLFVALNSVFLPELNLEPLATACLQSNDNF